MSCLNPCPRCPPHEVRTATGHCLCTDTRNQAHTCTTWAQTHSYHIRTTEHQVRVWTSNLVPCPLQAQPYPPTKSLQPTTLLSPPLGTSPFPLRGPGPPCPTEQRPCSIPSPTFASPKTSYTMGEDPCHFRTAAPAAASDKHQQRKPAPEGSALSTECLPFQAETLVPQTQAWVLLYLGQQ